MPAPLVDQPAFMSTPRVGQPGRERLGSTRNLLAIGSTPHDDEEVDHACGNAVRVVVQRVGEASVSVAEGAGTEREVARIGPGLLALVGFSHEDGEEALAWMARKIADLRAFEALASGSGFDRSLRETEGQLLVVSQFTLYGDARKGRRPDFTAAAPYDRAAELYEHFCELCEAELPGRVATGEFGARMRVSLVNDGPVTLILER
jgi:D-tyrosyl-tRNA(Tyr) deacylase